MTAGAEGVSETVARACSDVQRGGNAFHVEGVPLTADDTSFIGETLSNAPWVDRVYVVHCGLSDDGAACIADAVRNRSLVALSIYRNNVGSTGIAALSAVLRGMPRLSALNIGNNRLASDDMHAVVDALAATDKVDNLVLDGLPLDPRASRALGALLSDRWKSVRDGLLSLDNCGAGARGIRTVLRALKHRCPEVLRLGGNDLRDAGCADVLRWSTESGVTMLDIANNGIVDVDPIYEYMRSRAEEPRVLVLRGNPLGEDETDRIKLLARYTNVGVL